jgi:hypothetical protein
VSRLSLVLPFVVLLAAATCEGGSPHALPDDGGPHPGTGPPTEDLVPLIDLGTGRYLGRYEGGLYPGGADEPPNDHLLSGFERARRIQPLDTQGRPDPAGKIVLLSIGMSNAKSEFCGPLGTECNPGAFGGKALADPAVDRDHLVIVNGAQGGEGAEEWDLPSEEAYVVVRDSALAPHGLDERQVQAVWLKQAHADPRISLPDPAADAIELERDLGEIVRSLAARYPNLQLVFVSSRTYGGHATSTLNPEPFAYESGFSVKWLVEAQIEQARTGTVDPVAGDLGLEHAPWVGWGPYLWTDGAEGRSDGLVWLPEDVRSDGTHPDASGIRKVGDLLLDFFKTSPVARCWFLAGLDCGA